MLIWIVCGLTGLGLGGGSWKYRCSERRAAVARLEAQATRSVVFDTARVMLHQQIELNELVTARLVSNPIVAPSLMVSVKSVRDELVALEHDLAVH